MKTFSSIRKQYTSKIIIFSFFLFSLFLSSKTFSQLPNVPIGHWRDHLSYYKTQKLAEVEDRILVSAGSAMFFYDKSVNSIERFSKVNGLTDVGILTLAYDDDSKCIVIGYENSNIDIIYNDKVYNIPDIKIRSIEGSKLINNISFYNKKAYLSCGFGIVVLDLERKEIYDTYYIGNNSAKINVNNVVIFEDSIYAASSQGLLKAPYNSNTLVASESWNLTDNFPTSDSIEISFLLNFQGRLISGIKHNISDVSLFEKNGNSWDTILSNTIIYWIKVCGDKLVYKTWMGGGQSIVILDKNISPVKYFDITWSKIYNFFDDSKIITPEFGDVLLDGDDIWFAHEKAGGLVSIKNYMINSIAWPIYPNGPLSNDVYSITSSKEGIIYISPGGRNIQNAPRGVPANIYTFNGYDWDFISNFNNQDTLRDVIQVTINPNDPKKLIASSWWNGLIEIKDNKFVKVYNNETSNGVLKQPNYGYRIAGAEYDASGNLIIANSLSNTGLCYLTYKNVWGGFDTYSYIGNDEILGLMLDRFNHGNYYKFIWTKTNKILAFDNKGNTVLIDPNNGSKDKSNAINTMVQDHEGEIWIGTDKGIKVIYSLDNLYDRDSYGKSKITCNNIIYQENGIAQYLLNFENINTIMVDGGNRKWIGTERNGIFVYSPNGDKQLYHFTAENSPLVSNRVVSISQEPNSGEVYIGTDRGVVSYKAESTIGKENAGQLTAYPNPVNPDYNGLIAIKGFVKDSDVRITDLNGNSIAHLKAIGGQAIWNGKNFRGERISSGVYLIFGSALEGEENSSGKILFIR